MDIKNLFTGFSNRTYIVGIILGLTLYIFITEIFLRVYVIPNDKLSQIAVSVYESENRDVVIGDSQTVWGFREDYTAFNNLSFDGMPVETMEIILREYYRHKNPNRVIIIAGPQMLAENRVERGDMGFNKFFKVNIINPPFMMYAFERLVSRNLADLPKWINNMPRNKLTWKSGIEEKEREEIEKNKWEDIKEDTRIEMTRNRIDIQRPVENFHKTRNFNSYYRILDFLKEKNAMVCLLRMPVSVEYQELIHNDAVFLASEAAFKEMARLYEVRYVDFKQIPLSYDASFFINSDHLNEKGSKLFSPIAEKYCFEK